MSYRQKNDSNAMISGEICHYCGVYLEPNERVYLVHFDKGENPRGNMPKNGAAFGVPVECEDCHTDYKPLT